MMHILITTGIRSGDFVELNCGDVYPMDNEIEYYIKKSNLTRRLPIPRHLSLMLFHWLNVEHPIPDPDDSDPLFVKPSNTRISQDFLNQRVIKPNAEAAGIQEILKDVETGNSQEQYFGEVKPFYKVTAHTLRHTFRRLMHKGGVRSDVQDWALGHSPKDTKNEDYPVDMREEFAEHLPLIKLEY